MLIEALIQKQRELGMQDVHFAQELGFSRTFWNRVKNGKRGVTVAVLRAVLRRFPELEPDVLAFLQEEKTPAGRGAGRD